MSNVQNKWIVKDNNGDNVLIEVRPNRVVLEANDGEGMVYMFYNLERLDYLIESLQEARELYKNVRSLPKR
ncbi:hypothetical protein [Bacillus phage Anath]|uniref:Uncharacterized protein n=1 Tax=Bacillus phage Anath TaxID=2108114 RepID=A0A2P1JUR7_9CAUD|nr:hypothetical protein [Bacillus phage Anath]